MTSIYRSNLSCPDFQPKFAHAKPLAHVNACQHTVYGDPSLFEACGYCTHDEAAILFTLASALRGPWLEIGSHTGWGTVHLAAPGNPVIALEPEFKTARYNRTADASVFFRRFRQNVSECLGAHAVEPLQDRIEDINVFFENVVLHREPTALVQPHGEGSWDCMPQLALRLNGRFAGIFVDGEHEPPFPLVDAMLAAPLLAENSFTVFHDAIGSPVVAGALWLSNWLKTRNRRTRTRRFRTPQFLTVVASGTAVDVLNDIKHDPDPAFDWDRYDKQIDSEVTESLNKDYARWQDYARGWTRRPFSEW